MLCSNDLYMLLKKTGIELPDNAVSISIEMKANDPVKISCVLSLGYNKEKGEFEHEHKSYQLKEIKESN